MNQARKVGTRQKLFSLWMVLTFLWVSLIGLQITIQISPESPEQLCAKQAADERDRCIRIWTEAKAAKPPPTFPPRLAQYDDTQQLELMFGPPLWILAFGVIVALAMRGSGPPPSP